MFFLLTIAAAHAPDGDFIPYKILRNHLRYKSHHIIGHHPVFLIPLAGIAGWLIGGWYGVSLAVTAITLHFVHDSMQVQGIHWLSPFIWRRWSLRGFRLRAVPEDERIRFLESLDKRWSDGGGDIIGRLPALTKGEMAFCASAWAVLALYIIFT